MERHELIRRALLGEHVFLLNQILLPLRIDDVERIRQSAIKAFGGTHAQSEAARARGAAPSDSLTELRREADEIVCLEENWVFGAIGFYYRDFRQVSDTGSTLKSSNGFRQESCARSSLAGGVTRDGP